MICDSVSIYGRESVRRAPQLYYKSSIAPVTFDLCLLYLALLSIVHCLISPCPMESLLLVSLVAAMANTVSDKDLKDMLGTKDSA